MLNSLKQRSHECDVSNYIELANLVKLKANEEIEHPNKMLLDCMYSDKRWQQQWLVSGDSKTLSIKTYDNKRQ